MSNVNNRGPVKDTLAWNPQEGEPTKWFLRFERYRLLGPQRSILAAFKAELTETGRVRQIPPARAPETWYLNADTWQWQTRAEAWDAHLRAEDERVWKERRDALRQAEWDASQKLLEKARQMLSFPVATITSQDGKQTFIPAKWSFPTIAQFLETASRLGRSAADMDAPVKVALTDPTGTKSYDPTSSAQIAAGLAQLLGLGEPLPVDGEPDTGSAGPGPTPH